MADPFYVQWHITHACNLRCRHCYQDDFSKDSDLPWPKLKAVADNLLTALGQWDRQACIHLTGGEPLLQTEWLPLLQYLEQSAQVAELGVISNGLLWTPEIIRRLVSLRKLKTIKISLDGARAETNDFIRGKGVFEKAISQILQITHSRRWECLLMFTVMKTNLSELPAFLQLSRELAVDGVIIERFIPWGRGRKGFFKEVLTAAEWQELLHILADFFSLDEERAFLPYQAFQVKFIGEETELLGAPCVIGKDGLCVMPRGDVFPCRRFPLPLGNLQQDSLIRLWNESALLTRLREKKNLKGRCGTCPLKDCRGCRSLAFALTNDPLAEDPCCPYPFPRAAEAY